MLYRIKTPLRIATYNVWTSLCSEMTSTFGKMPMKDIITSHSQGVFTKSRRIRTMLMIILPT